MNRYAVSAALILALACPAVAQSSKLDEVRRKVAGSRRGEASARGHKTAVAAPAASAGASTEKFRIGIEYRGPIKKTDNDIGSAVMRCRTTGADSFEVTLDGHAVIPTKKKKHDPIDFEITRNFKLEGNLVKQTGGTEKFSSAAEKYRTKILNMLALAYLIKFRSPIYTEGQTPPVSWVVDARKYQFTYSKVGRPGAWREVQVSLNELTENNRFMGKFFLQPSAAAPSPFRKFRIQTKEKLGINFFGV